MILQTQKKVSNCIRNMIYQLLLYVSCAWWGLHLYTYDLPFLGVQFRFEGLIPFISKKWPFLVILLAIDESVTKRLNERLYAIGHIVTRPNEVSSVVSWSWTYFILAPEYAPHPWMLKEFVFREVGLTLGIRLDFSVQPSRIKLISIPNCAFQLLHVSAMRLKITHKDIGEIELKWMKIIYFSTLRRPLIYFPIPNCISNKYFV